MGPGAREAGTGMEQLLVGGVKNVAEQLRGYRALGFEYVALMPGIRDL